MQRLGRHKALGVIPTGKAGTLAYEEGLQHVPLQLLSPSKLLGPKAGIALAKSLRNARSGYRQWAPFVTKATKSTSEDIAALANIAMRHARRRCGGHYRHTAATKGIFSGGKASIGSRITRAGKLIGDPSGSGCK